MSVYTAVDVILLAIKDNKQGFSDLVKKTKESDLDGVVQMLLQDYGKHAVLRGDPPKKDELTEVLLDYKKEPKNFEGLLSI